MKGTQVAVRYARALFELALERRELEIVFGDMRLLHDTCVGSRDFRLMLKSPIVATDRKENIFRELFGKQISGTTLSFLLLLVRKRRERFIHPIADAFIEQFQDHMKILPVKVRSAVPLSVGMRTRLAGVMKKYTDAAVELEVTVDPEVIGGFLLSWKDKQIDTTISHEIERLKRGVARVNLYVKEI